MCQRNKAVPDGADEARTSLLAHGGVLHQPPSASALPEPPTCQLEGVMATAFFLSIAFNVTFPVVSVSSLHGDLTLATPNVAQFIIHS